jgi:hypothetical protein
MAATAVIEAEIGNTKSIALVGQCYLFRGTAAAVQPMGADHNRWTMGRWQVQRTLQFKPIGKKADILNV